LDPKIRDWVLIPIVVVMFLVAILRHNVTKLLRSDKKVTDLKGIRDAQILIRARRLRANANKIPVASFRMRKSYFNDKENGLLKDRPAAANAMANPMANPMMDPSNMADMMKKNVAMVVPQLLLMGWVNYFFSGFVLVKLPFPLPVSFKMMLQRGIDFTTLDASYVSSLSWYFLTMMGLRGINSLVLGDNVADDASMMQDQMNMQMGAAMGQQDVPKLFQAEKENLELVPHEWELRDIEKRVLGVTRKATTSISSLSGSPSLSPASLGAPRAVETEPLAVHQSPGMQEARKKKQ